MILYESYAVSQEWLVALPTCVDAIVAPLPLVAFSLRFDVVLPPTLAAVVPPAPSIPALSSPFPLLIPSSALPKRQPGHLTSGSPE